MDLYARVKSLAEQHGMTIARLEQDAGVANGTIGKWRNSNGPTVATLEKVAKALHMDIRDVFR